MPNGGSDCCGNCILNEANESGFNPNGKHYCKLRIVEINNPFWTYCGNFIDRRWSNKESRKTDIINGPIYASGIYEGYVRIPWNGKNEPETYVSGICSVTGNQFSEGIRVFDDKSQDYKYFESNVIYFKWFKNTYPNETLPFDYSYENNNSIEKIDLHKIYTEIYKQDFLKVDFIHLGKELNLGENELEFELLQNKVRGTLIGGAVGDALGRAVESINPGNYWIEKYEKWHGWKSGVIGTITDDTQMTMWLTESIIENKGLNPEHLAIKFTTQRIRGIGIATKEFVANFTDKKLPWYNSGVNSAGNGVAMRSSPIGIFYRNNYEELKLAAGIQAVITHNDPMAISSGIVVSLAIALLLRKNSDSLSDLNNKIEFCQILSSSIEGIESKNEYKTRNTNITTNIFQRIKYEIPDLLKNGIHPKEVNEIFWSGAYVLESLPFAIYCFLYTPCDFKTTLLNSVNLIRDSDTVSSIACSLSGALNSLDSIESYYTENLEYYDYLNELAEKLTVVSSY